MSAHGPQHLVVQPLQNPEAGFLRVERPMERLGARVERPMERLAARAAHLDTRLAGPKAANHAFISPPNASTHTDNRHEARRAPLERPMDDIEARLREH